MISDEAATNLAKGTIEEAVRTHFFHEEVLLSRRLRRHLRTGELSAAAGLAALILFLLLAEYTMHLPHGHLADVLRQGLTILGWVAMWRPLEALLFDWWPIVVSRRLVRRVLRADVVVRCESGSSVGAM